MKIKEVSPSSIVFDNNSSIWVDGECYNYADFMQLDDLALDYEFEEYLKFEYVSIFGFTFGDSRHII
jgi:hypothetical protein